LTPAPHKADLSRQLLDTRWWACPISLGANDVTPRPSIDRANVIDSHAASDLLTGSLKNLIAPPGRKPVTYAPIRSGWSVANTMATDTKSGGTGHHSVPASLAALLGPLNRALVVNTLPSHFSYVEER
jgi:hypothetical protein